MCRWDEEQKQSLNFTRLLLLYAHNYHTKVVPPLMISIGIVARMLTKNVPFLFGCYPIPQLQDAATWIGNRLHVSGVTPSSVGMCA